MKRNTSYNEANYNTEIQNWLRLGAEKSIDEVCEIYLAMIKEVMSDNTKDQKEKASAKKRIADNFSKAYQILYPNPNSVDQILNGCQPSYGAWQQTEEDEKLPYFVHAIRFFQLEESKQAQQSEAEVTPRFTLKGEVAENVLMAAALEGKSPSAFAREVVAKEAEQVLKRRSAVQEAKALASENIRQKEEIAKLKEQLNQLTKTISAMRW